MVSKKKPGAAESSAKNTQEANEMVENMSTEELMQAAKAQGMEIPAEATEGAEAAPAAAPAAAPKGPLAPAAAAKPDKVGKMLTGPKMEVVTIHSRLQPVLDKLHAGYSVDDVKKYQAAQKKKKAAKGKAKPKVAAKKPMKGPLALPKPAAAAAPAEEEPTPKVNSGPKEAAPFLATLKRDDDPTNDEAAPTAYGDQPDASAAPEAEDAGQDTASVDAEAEDILSQIKSARVGMASFAGGGGGVDESALQAAL